MEGFPIQRFLDNARALEKQVGSALAGSALNWSQYRLLAQLAADRQLTASQLSLRLQVAKPTVTHLLRQLQTMDVIAIRSDPADQRAKRLTLTRHGKLRLKIANDLLKALAIRLGETCPEQQLAVLRELDLASASAEPGGEAP